MKTKIALICAAVLLGGAGIVVANQAQPSQQALPDPNDADRIDQIAETLGTERSYDKKTLLINAEPDGLLFRRWMERRKATVDHKLPITKLPAPASITTVSAALAWERAVRDGDTNELNNYNIDLEQARGSCPQRFDREERWYEQEEAAHARGERASLIDWKTASAKFKSECAAEANG